MKKIYLPLLGVFFCLCSNNLQAQQMFLKAGTATLNGSLSQDYRDYVEISGAQYSVDTDVSYTGTKPNVGKPNFREIIVTKNADILSTFLLRNVARGTAIPKIEIITTQNLASGRPEVIQKIELNDVFVTNVSQAAVHGCSVGCGFTESVKLVYKQIRVTIYQISEIGKILPNPGIFIFDVSTGTEKFDGN